jgi:tRNA (guanine-N7-)-methyltransferase
MPHGAGNAADPVATAVFRPRSLTEPLPLAEMFEANGPLEVDVGCGKGRFLVARARAHPGTRFLGIDRLLARIRRADRKIVREGLGNVRLLRLEAAYAVKRLIPPGAVGCFYVFFPDPWPKRRHHRRRLFTREFAEALRAALAAGGTVHVVTDDREYGDEIESLFASVPGFEKAAPFEPASEEERTEFEIIFAGQHAPLRRFSFRTKLPGRNAA